MRHDGSELFAGLPETFKVGRYHSLVVDDLPPELVVTARIAHEDGTAGEIMAMQHRELPIYGLQFHPESVLTEHGFSMLANYLRVVEQHAASAAAAVA